MSATEVRHFLALPYLIGVASQVPVFKHGGALT